MRSFASSILTGLSQETRQAGFSFVELIIAVALLAIVAAAAIPALSPVSEKTLDIAASEVAAAIRYARQESLRTGDSYGVHADISGQRVRVYRLSGGFSLPDYSIYHPVDKKLYALNFNTDPVFSDVVIDSAAFNYAGSGGVREYVGFSESGTPKYKGFTGVFLLTSGSITLKFDGRQRLISVEPVTGRVTIQ